MTATAEIATATRENVRARPERRAAVHARHRARIRPEPAAGSSTSLMPGPPAGAQPRKVVTSSEAGAQEVWIAQGRRSPWRSRSPSA